MPPRARVGGLVGAGAAERIHPARLGDTEAAGRCRVSVTNSAAPWFTNGLAVSDFGYGNETMRLSGPTRATPSALAPVRVHAYGFVAATRASPAHIAADSRCASSRV